MKKLLKQAAEFHKQVPPNWYYESLKVDLLLQTYRDNYLPKLCRQVGFKIEVDKKFNLGMLHLVKVRK